MGQLPYRLLQRSHSLLDLNQCHASNAFKMVALLPEVNPRESVDRLTTDRRGLPRPIGDPNITNAEGGDGCDIGAYEADPNLRVTGIGKTGGDVCLSFNSMLGKTYRVESTDEQPPATWNELTNNVPGTGGRIQALDVGAATLPKRFYPTFPLP